MVFRDILKAVRKAYQVSCCFIADHREVEDETVDRWLKGTRFPNEKQAKDFSARFAIPLTTVMASIEEGGKKNETNTDHSGL